MSGRLDRAPAFVLAIAALAACSTGDSGDSDQPRLPPDMADMTPQIALETSKGRIVIELDRERAPKTVEQILTHVRGGFYDGLIFHRVIPDFMIQGGGFTQEMGQRQSNLGAIQNEADNGLKNVRGSVAMARTADPHSATTQFFINLTDNPNLDFTGKTARGWGYAVFGHVVEGMDVVDSIAAVPTTTRGRYENLPVDPVVIESASVVDEAADTS